MAPADSDGLVVGHDRHPFGQEQAWLAIRRALSQSVRQIGRRIAFNFTQQASSSVAFVATTLIGERIDIRKIDPRSDAARFCLDRYYQELDA